MNTAVNLSLPAQLNPTPLTPSLRQLYDDLLHAPESVAPASLARFLDEQLAAADALPCDMPEDPRALEGWIRENTDAVSDCYADYLQQRHDGGPRQFFSNKAHALHFLRQVAPTKLVDGAWLYGALKHAEDWRYKGLVRTYLEELGDGDPDQNHVVLYRQLLDEHECHPGDDLPEGNYLQGALQLALGAAGDDYLPEAIGYNLGYEQLPLHLLISAFELNELGIDPYYFTLHVTIDNASSGHARKAAQAVRELLPPGEDPTPILARIARGYRLNDLGAGSRQVIERFDLEEELFAMLERKRSFARNMHSDYCKLDGRTVNEWLAEPGQVRGFIGALERRGWIKRGQDPMESRFWQLIEGTGAPMFGVFDGFERQLIRDWIANGWQADARKPNAFRNRFRALGHEQTISVEDADLQRDLARRIGRMSDKDASAHLCLLLSPAHHATPEGLAATRLFLGRPGKRSVAPSSVGA